MASQQDDIGGISDAPMLSALRRRMGIQTSQSAPAPAHDIFAPIFHPQSTPTAYPSSPARSDPTGFLKPIGDFVGGAKDALGGAISEVHKLPVLGGALDVLGAAADATLGTPVGLAALGADQLLHTGLTEAAQKANAGRPIWELPKTATNTALAGIGQVADDPNADLLSRVVAGGARAVHDVGQFVAPIPGVGVLSKLKNAATASRVGKDIAAPLADAARLATEAPKPHVAPIEAAVAPLVDSGPNVVAALERRVGRPTFVPEPPVAAELRDLGFRPETFARLEPDLQRSIQRDHLEEGGFTAQRRGVQPIEETKRLAESVGIDPTTVRPGKAFNAEEIYSLTKSVATAATERRAVQAEIAKLGGPSFASADQNARLLLAAVKQASYERVLSGARTEAGRSLRIQREALEAAILDPSERTYQHALTSVGGRDNAEALMGGLNDIYARDVPDAVKEADTMAFLRSATKSGTAAKVKEYWVNSILSNPVTHEINTLSNAAFALAQIPTRYLAAGVDAARAGVARTPREVFFSEANASVAGAMRGITTGVRKGLDIARNGYSIDDVAKFRETGKLGQTQAIGGKLGTVVNIPSRLMSAADAVFKGIGYSSEIYALAARDAAKTGLKGDAFAQRMAELVKDPTTEMVDAATKHAKYITFQSDPGEMTALVQKMRRAGPAGEALGFVIPFVQTPTNLFKRGLEYSPLGVVQAIRATTGAERSMAFARASLGSAVLAAMVPKFFTGELTGPAPTNVAERDAFYRSGKMPYSIKIGDQWIEYKRLEPMFSFLRPLAAALQAAKETGGPPSEEMIGPAIGAFVSALKDQSYLTGVEDLLNAMDDPARFGERFIAHVATGFVPYSGLLRGVAQAEDPYLRDPKGIAQNIEAGLPGASRDVPPMLDLLRGEPVLRQPTQQGAGAFLNPVKASPAETNPVDAEIALVQQYVPDLGQTGAVGTTLAGEKLSQQDRFRYQELTGKQYDDLQALFGSPSYAAMSWTDKAKAIDSARSKARDAAKKSLAVEQSHGDIFAPIFKSETKATGDVFGHLFSGVGHDAATPSTGDIFAPLFGGNTRMSSGGGNTRMSSGGGNTRMSSGGGHQPSPIAPGSGSPAGDVPSIIQNTARSSGIDPRLALAVAQVESGLNPYAVGDNGNSHGLFQENVHGRGAGRAPDYDPARQTARFAADVRAYVAQHPNASPGEVAAAVQRPFDPAGYARKVNAAYATVR